MDIDTADDDDDNYPGIGTEHNVSDKAAGEFGKSTSMETVTVVDEEKLFNVNVSKDSALCRRPSAVSLPIQRGQAIC